jgi:hypothetical protein
MLRDHIERWAPRAFVIAALLAVGLFLASPVVIYIGDEYGSPAWSQQSVPAPQAN